MNTHLQKYKTLLAKRGMYAGSYSHQRLEVRFKIFFGESIVIRIE